jgi:hypothetical protein
MYLSSCVEIDPTIVDENIFVTDIRLLDLTKRMWIRIHIRTFIDTRLFTSARQAAFAISRRSSSRDGSPTLSPGDISTGVAILARIQWFGAGVRFFARPDRLSEEETRG